MRATILERIAADKKAEISVARRQEPEDALRRRAEEREAPRPLAAVLGKSQPDRIGIIAEIKRASPSRGVIREPLDPADYARRYQAGGAAALSVLTDTPYFRGSLADLAAARQAVSLPVLRKDFLLSTYQIYESAASGADAVLLIVRLLERGQLRDYLALCRELCLDALVEVHDEPDLDQAAEAGAELVGINNRDLATFATDTNLAARLAAQLEPHQVAVAASGIRGANDVRRTRQAGIYNFLVGESLVRAEDTVGFLRQLRAA